jgi:hypothetical protein
VENSSVFHFFQVPDGYEVRRDPGGKHYVNMFTGVRWFAARDAANNGQVYFYEENGNESCWRLPSVGQSIQDNSSEFCQKVGGEKRDGCSYKLDIALV